MPTAFIQRLARVTNLSVDKLEGYWERAKRLADAHYDKDSEEYYPVATKIFKNIVGAKHPKAWRKYAATANADEHWSDDTLHQAAKLHLDVSLLIDW
jgi:hypothetical protein